MSTTLEAPAIVAPELAAYMKKCGGRDILVFDSSSGASEAAHIMRERGVEAEARYERVFVSYSASPTVRRATRRA